MRLILYTWGSNSDNILKRNLIRLGHMITVYDQKCEHYTRDLKFAQGLINLIHECSADAVVTNDYFPIISMVCNTTGILYYSWVYDSPHYTLFASTSKYTCNRIGCFDRALVERLNGIGINAVKHLPLGVDWSYLKSKSATDYGKCKCDISFVGSLYTGVHNYYDDLNDGEIRTKADELIKSQCFEYEKDYLSRFFKDDEESYKDCNKEFKNVEKGSGTNSAGRITDRVKKILIEESLLPGDEYIKDIEYIFNSHFLEKKVTVEERHILLNEVAKKGYDFALYTGSDLTKEPGLKKANRGIADYHKEMPYVFRDSKINLNITLRSIRSGIPLRALDIMGCGGFLLSNYQEELKEYFREDEELVMFYGLEDCLEKIDYYICHEDERKRIAAAGRKAVEEKFKYKDQLVKLLNMS